MRTNSLSAWILAVRPYSLGNSVILVLVASAMAWTDGGFRPGPAALCLAFALLMQCTANLVNDLSDFLKGADRPDRLGPDRAFAKGYITLPAMKAGIAGFTLAACAAGAGILCLTHGRLPYGGWELVAVGLACVVFAYFYTAGPWPLAYHGLGDAAVVLFFGLIPVGFTYYVQTGQWTAEVTLVALACGLVIDTMLMLNNFRDREEDARCGKRTIVVLTCAAVGRWGYLLLGLVPAVLCLTLLAAPLRRGAHGHVAQDGAHRPRRGAERLPGRDGAQHPPLRSIAHNRHPARLTMAEERHITLRELQRLVRQTLEERFALPVWISAEISEIKINRSGHCYLELVEKGGDNGVPTAQARAVIWRSHYPRIAGYFEAETGQRLEAGIQILARVLVTYHEIYGFSLQITDMDPSYTLGDMERQRQRTIAQLQRDGVWDMNRETPAVVQRVAVVSSANAAGYQDFCKELDKSPYRFALTLFDAFMQGAAAEESIVEALCAVAARQEEFDAVVLIRGGGSRSDLNCFNAYRLCSHIAQFPLPVATGIGHDKDTSVADMVAHTALKTPTAVAGWLVERMAGADGRLDVAALQLHDATTALLHASEVRLERLRGELRQTSGTLLTRQTVRLEHLAATLPEAARGFLARQLLRLDNAAELVAGRSPEQILRLGFAVVRSGGRAVVSAGGVGPGDALRIEVADGTIEATVKNTKIWQKKS